MNEPDGRHAEGYRQNKNDGALVGANGHHEVTQAGKSAGRGDVFGAASSLLVMASRT